MLSLKKKWPYPFADVDADDIDDALTRIAQQTPFLSASKEEAAHYREQARLLFVDEEEEEDADAPPHERFERAHARLMSAPSSPPLTADGALVVAPLPPPSPTVLMAREQLGHDPLTAHIAGRLWTALEWRPYGATHCYGAVRARRAERTRISELTGPKRLGDLSVQTWPPASRKAQTAGQLRMPAWGTEGL
jgi:hypothetical protein